MESCPTVALSRREFSVKGIYGLAALVGLGLAAPATVYIFGSPVEADTGWIDAGAIGSLPEGQPVELPIVRVHRDGWRITAQQDTVWVVKQGAQLTAFSPRCTHLGCAYHWDQAKDVFVCPCHGSVFSKTGEVLAGPAPRPLDRLVTKIEGDRLWLGDRTSEAEKRRT